MFFLLQSTANSPCRKLAIKRDTFLISYTEYKIRKFLFIHRKSISSFVHLTLTMLGIKEAKHSTKTATSDRKSEDLHDDPKNIVRTPLNQVIRVI